MFDCDVQYGPCKCGGYHTTAGVVLTMPGKPEPEAVNHPAHYNSHPSGIEAIEICRHENFNIGNVFKYLFRAGRKSENVLEDLKKARWYLDDEITRITDQTNAPKQETLSG